MIRPAAPDDVRTIHALICDLARYEKLEHQVTGTPDDLGHHLFGEPRYAEALVAEDVAGDVARADGLGAGGVREVVGFALFFHNYSTFLARPGVYLEDLFVSPEHRRRGHGRALLREVARIAVARGCGRLEWSVLDWNAPAIAFYRSIGAPPMDDWRICRLTAQTLTDLASVPA